MIHIYQLYKRKIVVYIDMKGIETKIWDMKSVKTWNFEKEKDVNKGVNKKAGRQEEKEQNGRLMAAC